ncbi:hypothetical protein RYX36_017242 [Vicia faba]
MNHAPQPFINTLPNSSPFSLSPSIPIPPKQNGKAFRFDSDRDCCFHGCFTVDASAASSAAAGSSFLSRRDYGCACSARFLAVGKR